LPNHKRDADHEPLTPEPFEASRNPLALSRRVKQGLHGVVFKPPTSTAGLVTPATCEVSSLNCSFRCAA